LTWAAATATLAAGARRRRGETVSVEREGEMGCGGSGVLREFLCLMMRHTRFAHHICPSHQIPSGITAPSSSPLGLERHSQTAVGHRSGGALAAYKAPCRRTSKRVVRGRGPDPAVGDGTARPMSCAARPATAGGGFARLCRRSPTLSVWSGCSSRSDARDTCRA